MRPIVLIAILVLGLGCAGTKQTAKTTVATKSVSLDGSWLPIKEEMNGSMFPEAVYKKQKLVLHDSAYIMTAESVDNGVVRYNGSNKMDIYGTEGVNKGKHFTAIYKYDGDLLTICYNLAGNSYPETFETKDKPGIFLAVFKKEVAK